MLCVIGSCGGKGKILAGFCVKKPFTVLVVIIIIFALGFVSFRSMKPELLPNLELPYVIAMTTYPGATSERVETEVSRPLEQGFATLGGLKTIESQSQANYSMIMMEFVDGTNLDTTSIDIMQRINQVSGSWDDLVGTPVIIKLNPNMLPVMIAAVEQEGSNTENLSRFVEETLRNKLEGIDGVASLDISGLRREQVNVMIRAEKVEEVNSWIAASIETEIADKEYDLRKTKSDLQSKLDDLKGANTEVEDGVNELAGKLGEGWASLPEMIAEKINEQLVTMQTTLNELKAALDGINQQLQPYIDGLVLAWKSDPANAGFTDEQLAAVTEMITLQVQEQSGLTDTITQLNEGIAALEKGISDMQTQMPQIIAMAQQQAEGAIMTTSIETQHKLSSAAAAIVAGQAQLSAGIAQIDTGLEQFEDALEDALKAADMRPVLTMAMVSTILKAQNFAMPAGTVTQGHTDYLVRVGDEVASIEELSDMALMDTGMDGVGVIRLSDVADVFMSDNLANVYAKINGNDGVLLMFSKQSEYSTTVVTDAIVETFENLSSQYPGLNFTPLMNQGDYIYDVINSILADLLWGALFAILILLLFLRDLRPTFVTLCAIPISLVFALTAMYFAGVTINIISLGGLAIAVGRLVDDSVVVMENIFRLRAKGYSAVKAAVSGTAQVAGAITASTLTTVCVFLPLVFVQGLTRQIFKDFGLTFAFALLASLLVAMTLVPTVASGLFRNMVPKEHHWLDRVIAGYDKALVWSLGHKALVLIVTVVLLAGSAGAVLTKGFEYFPEDSMMNQITVDLSLPKETTLEQRRETADEATSLIMDIPGVETVGMMTGSGGSGGGGIMSLFSGGTGNMRNFTSYVLVEDGGSGTVVIEEIKTALEDIDAEVSVGGGGEMDVSMLGGSGITINIFGDNTRDLMEASKRISDITSVVPGIAEVDDGLGDATPELHFTVDRQKAAIYGLTTAQVFQEVSAALTKENSSTQVTWRGDSYNVYLSNENVEEGTLTPEYIKSLEFTATKRDGTRENVKLSDISTVNEAQALPSILRSDQRRYLPVNLTIEEGYNVTLVTQAVESKLESVKLPNDVSYEVTGENATIMDAFEQLALMLVLGLLLVYLIMVAQFQSLKSPFIIMFSIPLAFTGGFIAILISGTVLSVISLIGFAMLIGVIVANAIVLIDYINRLRLDGLDRVAAIREGAATRMRPILMTALATIFALLMMALGVGEGSNMLQPLAVVCVGGLAYGTFMTLFVVPIIYDMLNKKELRKIDDADLIVDKDA